MTIHDPRNAIDFEPDERRYPCSDCGALRTKAEGGIVFAVCDACWGKGVTDDPTREPEPNTAPRFVARVVALAAKLPNDNELGAAVRALIGGER